MTIFQLECYYALTQSLNFTQTANQQFITQPALSRSISALEQELGITLIQRTTHRVALTPAGRIFASECKKIIAAYQAGVQNAQLATQSLIGNLRLGVPVDSFEPLAVRLTHALAQEHSGIHVELKFNTPTGLIRSLDNGLVDAIIASGKPQNIDSQYLLIDQRQDYVVLPCGHPLANREEISFSELRHQNFIAISRAASAAGYESILTYGSEAGFSPNITAQASTVSSLLMMVACGAGISILYLDHQAICGDSAVFIPLTEGKMFNRYLIWVQKDNPCIDTVANTAKKLFFAAEQK